MMYSGVVVFGDSLVDAGNALKLAQTYNYFPFTSLPNGAPTTAKGYHEGRFTDGWTYADLISNKYLSVPTKSVFPFGYDDPYLGISFGFFSDPNGNNLNFAYGGAQLRQGEEAVPDIDDQTDAFEDAVDGDADPNALHMFSFGANDVHDLVPKNSDWVSWSSAYYTLLDAADELIEEVQQVIENGARHILITGVPDIGIQPYYNGTDNEAERRAVATEYANMLDSMIQARLGELAIEGVTVTFIDWDQMSSSVLGTMVSLYGQSEIYPLNLSNEVFFDLVHPTAQLHALAAAYMIDQLSPVPAGERMPLTAPDYSMSGMIGTKGEIDTITISLAANATYTFDLLGISTLGGNHLTLADPLIKLFGPTGSLISFNDDGGLGLDSTLSFTAGVAGDYTLQLSGVGSMTGGYVFRAEAEAGGNNSYSVSHASALVIEDVGGGYDTVRSSVSYALNAGSEVEVLRTTNDNGKGAINLTGNEFGQTIVGNGGSNILEGKGGADILTGRSGKDVFVLGNSAVINPDGSQIDRITDYGSGDIVDVSQVVSVAAGTSIATGGYVRITSTGLVQVDVDGGGNSWTTLSQINGSGSVAVRYLSGGVLTTASLSRVAVTSTSTLASSIGAAGVAAMALMPDPSDQSIDQASASISTTSSIEAAGQQVLESPSMQWDFSGAALSTLASSPQNAVAFQQVVGRWQVQSLDENRGPDSEAWVPAAAEGGPPLAISEATVPPVAMSIAIPPSGVLNAIEAVPDVAASANQIVEVLLDALGRPGAAIDGLLQHLVSGDAGLEVPGALANAVNPAFDLALFPVSPMPVFLTEAAASSPDQLPLV